MLVKPPTIVHTGPPNFCRARRDLQRVAALVRLDVDAAVEPQPRRGDSVLTLQSTFTMNGWSVVVRSITVGSPCCRQYSEMPSTSVPSLLRFSLPHEEEQPVPDDGAAEEPAPALLAERRRFVEVHAARR